MTNKRVECKKEDWLTPEELAQRICACSATIRGRMNQFKEYNTLGDDIQYVKFPDQWTVCLRNDEQVIKNFCAAAHFTQIYEVEIVPKEWLTARDLINRGYVIGRHSEIFRALRQYQIVMPEYIKSKPNGSRMVPSLRHDAIDLFCAKANIERSTPDDKNWLSAPCLVNQERIGGTYAEIHAAMKQLQAEMPEYIQKRFNGLRRTLCLHSSAVEKFCELSGLEAINSKHR